MDNEPGGMLFFRRWTRNKDDRTTRPEMVYTEGQPSEGEETAADTVGDEDASQILVDFAFELDLEHPAIPLSTMFAATLAFDEHEIDEARFGTGAATDLIVDVVSIERTCTTLRITPVRGLSYDQMASEVEDLVKRVNEKLFDGNLTASSLRWYIRDYGVSSDQRRNYKRVA